MGYGSENNPVIKVDISEEVTAQLVQKTNQLDSLEFANAKDSFAFQNYLNNNQNIHPKVLYFADGWKGYKYWMAYTPYPDGATSAENPCIAVSNDLINWTIPNGLTNPLDPAPANGYNSDTHLIYRDDISTIEIWWRTVNTTDNTFAICRRTSTDGVTWNAKEIIIPYSVMSNDMLSPAIIFESGKYKMWSCTGTKVRYSESTDNTATTWSNPVILNINWGTLSAWHLDVIKTELGYEMIVCAFEPGGSNNTADLYYLIQNLDGTFTEPKPILKKSKNPSAMEFSAIYRSSILKIDGVYYIIYSCIASNGARHMSLSYGSNIFGLNGYENLNKFLPNSRVVRVNGGTTLTEYDIANIDVLIISGGTTPAIINSFKGGYQGKTLHVIIEGSTASATFKYNSTRLLLPKLADFTLNTANMGMTLICTNTDGKQFRGYTQNITPNAPGWLPGGETKTDYDVSNVDVIKVAGTSPEIFNSFVGGYDGKKVTIILAASAASAQFIYNSSRLITPSNTNYTLDTTKLGLTIICTDGVNQVWKVMI